MEFERYTLPAPVLLLACTALVSGAALLHRLLIGF